MKIVLFLILVCCASSCATIVHGKSQQVAVVTEPPGATVIVDGSEVGATPLTLTLERKNDHTVYLSKNGYQATLATLERSVSGLAAFYLLPGGLLSLGIDSAHGSLYNLPPKVDVTLEPIFTPRALLAFHVNQLKALNQKLFRKRSL